MIALNEWKSPQWNVQNGGRALLVLLFESGRLGSIFMSSSSAPVYLVTGSPVSVVSSVSSIEIVPGEPWENVSLGVFRPGAFTSDHWFCLAIVSSAGLNRHSMLPPFSGSMNAFTGAAAVAPP